MDVSNATDIGLHIGKNGAPAAEQPQPGAAPHDGNPDLKMARCDVSPKGMHVEAATGALHHDIDPALQVRMSAYFAPSNRELYNFLGRDLGW